MKSKVRPKVLKSPIYALNRSQVLFKPKLGSIKACFSSTKALLAPLEYIPYFCIYLHNTTWTNDI
jgi:hypothetical protein